MDRADAEVLARYKGELYQDAVRRCLTGGKKLGLEKNAVGTNAEVGAAMHEVYSSEVVRNISDMRI